MSNEVRNVDSRIFDRIGELRDRQLLGGAMATSALAQIAPAKESLSDLYPGKAYSPYAQRSFPGGQAPCTTRHGARHGPQDRPSSAPPGPCPGGCVGEAFSHRPRERGLSS